MTSIVLKAKRSRCGELRSTRRHGGCRDEWSENAEHSSHTEDYAVHDYLDEGGRRSGVAVDAGTPVLMSARSWGRGDGALGPHQVPSTCPASSSEKLRSARIDELHEKR